MSASPTGQTQPTPEVPAVASDMGTQDHTLWSNDAVKQLALPEPREPLTPATHAAVLRTLSREDVRRLPPKLGVPLPVTFSGSSGLDDSLSQADSAANSLLSGTSGSCQGGGQGVGIGASNVAGPAQYLPRFAAVSSAALLDMVHVLHSARRFDEMLAAAVVAIRRRVCATRRGVAAAGQVHNVVELAGKSCCSRSHLSHRLTRLVQGIIEKCCGQQYERAFRRKWTLCLVPRHWPSPVRRRSWTCQRFVRSCLHARARVRDPWQERERGQGLEWVQCLRQSPLQVVWIAPGPTAMGSVTRRSQAAPFFRRQLFDHKPTSRSCCVLSQTCACE